MFKNILCHVAMSFSKTIIVYTRNCTNVQVTIVLGRVIVPWTIVDFHEENVTFSEFFSCIKAGQYHNEVTEELKRARLLKTFVGNKIDALEM